MKPVYRAPLYHFLQFLDRNDLIRIDQKSILDCGAGGVTPALGLFYEHGFATHGIDISDEQIALAHAFENKYAMQLNLQKGDMRAIPFPDDHFDFVFEVYSMVHLSKVDIQKTLSEMKRILKPNGICFVSFMSSDSFPLEGEERGLGEIHGIEFGNPALHSVFSNQEALSFVSNWKILHMFKLLVYSPDILQAMTEKKWQQYYKDHNLITNETDWSLAYLQRLERWQFDHLFFILQK